MIKVGVIGYGYWGPNLVRNFATSGKTTLAMVCDLHSKRLAQAQLNYPGVKVTTDYREVIADPGIDAIAVATPVSTHFPLVMAALQAGKHVLVEKPLTSSAEEGRRLLEEVEKRQLVLLVGHTFTYTGAVRKIRELIHSGELGLIWYYDSIRVNLGMFQHDVDVIWDLAVHDLSILDFVLDAKPLMVSATGMCHVAGRRENVAYLTLFFDHNLIGHINVNWLSPVKVRQTLIGGSKKMIVYDDLEPSEKIKVYDRGITVSKTDEQRYQILVDYRTGDMWAPWIDRTEALKTEVRHFAACIEEGSRPLTDVRVGLRVVSMLEAASQSMKENGKPIKLQLGELA